MKIPEAEFENIMKQREVEEKRRADMAKQEEWGAGWNKKKAKNTPTQSRDPLTMLLQCVQHLFGWLRGRPQQSTVNQ